MTSPSTGSLVLSMYCPVYDADGNPIGFTGMALQANELLDTLNELEFIGLDGCTYYLLDAKNSNYISCNDQEKIGTPVENANFLSMIENTATLDSDNLITQTEYKDTVTGAKKLALYKFLPDKNWIFVVEVAQKELFKGTVKLSVTIFMLSLIILVISILVVLVLSNVALKPIEKMCKIITSISMLDMTQGAALKKYMNRGDETGLIAKATYQLTEELTKIVTELRSESSLLLDASGNMMKIFSESVDSVNLDHKYEYFS